MRGVLAMVVAMLLSGAGLGLHALRAGEGRHVAVHRGLIPRSVGAASFASGDDVLLGPDLGDSELQTERGTHEDDDPFGMCGSCGCWSP